MEDVGVTRVEGRQVKLFQLSHWEWEEPQVAPFVLFVAADASDDELARIQIQRFAADAIESGCGYLGAWGNGCEFVHDLFDVASIAADRFVMSDWHANDSLAGALYLSLVAWPDTDEFPDAADAAIVLAVEAPWIAEVRRLVADQDELVKLWVEEP
jgi:hypothetical protein